MEANAARACLPCPTSGRLHVDVAVVVHPLALATWIERERLMVVADVPGDSESWRNHQAEHAGSVDRA